MFIDFPNEIQCQVIRLLDPIGLISLSQSSRHFRRLINPQKRNLVERLLQLELSNEHGGPTLIFRSRDSKLEPGWQDEAWESMRWACTDCLRLLSHKSFDNQSLLRLGYRKPLPNSDASRMITTWENRLYWRPQHRLMRGSEEYRLEKSRRELYLRKCNECRFHKGFLSYTRFAGDRGSRNLPVVPSRRVSFATELDRHFPGFLSTLKSKEPPVENPSASGYLYSMYMARCSKCERWQEIRSFRTEGLCTGWRHSICRETELLGQDYDNVCCNRCLVDTRGRGKLAESLKTWFVTLLNKRVTVLSSQLYHQFNSHLFARVCRLPQIEAGEWRVLVEQTLSFNPGNNLSLLREDLDLIHTRRRQWKDLVDKAKEIDAENSHHRFLDGVYDEWVRQSDAIESKWRWLLGFREEIEDNAELLVDWALHRDGAAFM
ncbi:hypothetical protein FOC1_g10012213 [Fusarium oxysporum f. sp. cubense race 1]|uniref:F-box domain-containing protein n=1 Tax=Fusarium oxysporum f. sp. cubense (strain race 1) TaxID=1229664 RepID=N4U548_FUSC1|nr:hypothetical protein FOC1_g10012213 [Fusarium oxysporum f. sp. cubense race 1]